MDAISDPGRASRRDRRRAQKLIDTAFAEQRLTAADRALRTQRIQAAHTRGDLTMITRDLVAPAQANLGRALDPATMSSMRVDVPRPTPRLTPQMARTIDLSSAVGRRVKWLVIIVAVTFLGTCLLGLFTLILPVFLGFDDELPDPAPSSAESTTGRPPRVDAAVDLHTAAGWAGLVGAIEAASGTTKVYDLVVYPQYASVGLDGGDAVERRFFRGGSWQDSVAVRTPITGSPVDLADIDAQVIARLPEDTARHFGIDEPTGSYIVVTDFAGDPRIMVYVQSDGRSEYRAYRPDGQPLS